MKIVAETKDDIRNSDLGDYFTIDGVDHYEIRSTGNEFYDMLILLHEMVEYTLLKKEGIREEIINEWDANHMDAIDPALVKGSPYKEQHIFAENIERMVCQKLGLDWNEYDEHVMNLIK